MQLHTQRHASPANVKAIKFSEYPPTKMSATLRHNAEKFDVWVNRREAMKMPK